MIDFVKGDLFKSKAEALVNPVNCEGVMGKGLAKEFKDRWPGMYLSYQRACMRGELAPGGILLYAHSVPKIVFFATKGGWRLPSRIEYIEEGLVEMKRQLPTWLVSSVAMPAVGCGLGGLAWREVKERIQKHLSGVETRIEVYEPE